MPSRRSPRRLAQALVTLLGVAGVSAFGGNVRGVDAQADAPPLATLMAEHGELRSALTAVEAIGLGGRLADCAAEPLTVLAPIDTAFLSIAGEMGTTPEALLLDTASLQQIIPHHLVDGARDAAALIATGLNPTLHGDDLDVFAEGDLTLLDGYASMLEADLVGCNGVLHIVDSVLVPLDFVLGETPVVDGGVEGEVAEDGTVVEADTGSDQRAPFLVLSVLALGAGIGMVNMANRRRPR